MFTFQKPLIQYCNVINQPTMKVIIYHLTIDCIMNKLMYYSDFDDVTSFALDSVTSFDLDSVTLCLYVDCHIYPSSATSVTLTL